MRCDNFINFSIFYFMRGLRQDFPLVKPVFVKKSAVLSIIDPKKYVKFFIKKTFFTQSNYCKLRPQRQDTPAHL